MCWCIHEALFVLFYVFFIFYSQTYRERATAMIQALAHPKWQGLLSTHTAIHGGGGYYIWTQLGDRVKGSAKEVDHIARRTFGVGVKEGSVFACPGGGAGAEREGIQRCMRLCVAFYETEELLEGLDRLHLALQASRMCSL
jgi:DNA-binding transcriptional MocR family regulator